MGTSGDSSGEGLEPGPGVGDALPEPLCGRVAAAVAAERRLHLRLRHPRPRHVQHLPPPPPPPPPPATTKSDSSGRWCTRSAPRRGSPRGSGRPSPRAPSRPCPSGGGVATKRTGPPAIRPSSTPRAPVPSPRPPDPFARATPRRARGAGGRTRPAAAARQVGSTAAAGRWCSTLASATRHLRTARGSGRARAGQGRGTARLRGAA